MGVTQRQTLQLQPRRLREWVPGSSLLQQTIQTSSTFSSSSTSLSTPRKTTVEMAVSKIRQNYHEDCEALINKQINMEFYASYVYLSMSSYFNRDDQALHGFAAHFKTESGEERAHGMKLMEYQTVNQSLLDLHKVAGDKGDGHLCDFLESDYLGEQVEGIKAIGDLITKMKRAGDGLGLHLIDKEMGS